MSTDFDLASCVNAVQNALFRAFEGIEEYVVEEDDQKIEYHLKKARENLEQMEEVDKTKVISTFAVNAIFDYRARSGDRVWDPTHQSFSDFKQSAETIVCWVSLSDGIPIDKRLAWLERV